jgi:hypothetical protein
MLTTQTSLVICCSFLVMRSTVEQDVVSATDQARIGRIYRVDSTSRVKFKTQINEVQVVVRDRWHFDH